MGGGVDVIMLIYVNFACEETINLFSIRMLKDLFRRTRLAMLATLLAVLPVHADVTPDQLQFSETEGGYAVSKAEGATLSGALVIPETFNDQPVVLVADKAFKDSKDLTAVTIPASVRKLGTEAFAGCKNLSMITLPEGLKYINAMSFTGVEQLKSIDIPATVTFIDFMAFSYCYGLECINVADGNTSYRSVHGIVYSRDMQTLYRCPNNYSGKVQVPDGVKTIAGAAFVGCAHVTVVSVPASVENIGGMAFFDCHNLRSIDVAEGNTFYRSVHGVLFDHEMKTILRCPGGYRGKFVIPAGVTSVGKAFSGCHRLTAVHTAEGNATYLSVNGVLYDKDMHTLLYCPGGRRGTVVVPDGVTAISHVGFFDCFHLKRIDLPATLEGLGYRVFWHCKALERLTCRATTPPQTKRDTFETLYEKDAHYQSLPLCVPAASLDAYRQDKAWGRFQNILPLE